ncbi:TIP1-2 [Scenedesmus sp. PABB004]|nr:TIP1-2 [Scenedesmus sp. PABB004]
MPGLLQTEASTSSKLAAAVACEAACTFLFAFIGGAAPGGAAAAANGLGLAVLSASPLPAPPRRRAARAARARTLPSRPRRRAAAPRAVYVAANVSGGHLNPAVSFATTVTGHSSGSRALYYILAQTGGAVLASLLHMALIPRASDVGCFAPHIGVGLWRAFGWETVMTFMLVVTVYSVAVGEPSFGIVGPLAIGLAVYAAALAGGFFTGAAMNPARVLGPAIVWGCGWRAVPAYIGGELLGALLGAVVSWPLYGTGLQLGRWFEHAEGALADARQAIRGGYERLEGAVHGGAGSA